MLLNVIECSFYLLLSYLILFTYANYTAYKMPANERIIWYKNFATEEEYLDKQYEDQLYIERYYHFSGNEITYFDKKQQIKSQYKLKKDEFIVESRLGYITYEKLGHRIRFFDSYGTNKWNLQTASYPLLSKNGDRVLLLSTDTSTFSLYDFNMNPLITNKTITPLITDYAFCNFDNSLTLSTIDAEIFNIDFRGNITFQKKLSDSQYNYIKGVAISSKKNYTACIAGLYPEYLYLLDQNGEVLWKKETKLNRRKKSNLFIDHFNELVFDLQINKIVIYTLKTGEIYDVLNIADFDLLESTDETLRCHYASVDNYYATLIETKFAKKICIFNLDKQIIFNKTLGNVKKMDAFYLFLNETKDMIYINVYTQNKIISSLLYL